MAISYNPALRGIRRQIEKTIVVRDCPLDESRVIITSYPDMTKIIPSEKQKARRLNFKEAQQTASAWMKQPEIKAYYQSRCQPGQRAYDLMKSELMKGIAPEF
jgi:hypothetical protein